jgi:hypothetical protein
MQNCSSPRCRSLRINYEDAWMEFEHDALVVYLKSITPKGDEDHEQPEINIVVQVSKGDAGEHWHSVLDSFMSAPGDNGERDWDEFLLGLGQLFDGPLKLHRQFSSHIVNFHQSTIRLASLNPADIHRAKIEWANDHHDDRLQFTVTARVDGHTAGVLCEYLGHKLRLEAVCPQEALPLD